MFFFPPKEEPLDHFWTHLYIYILHLRGGGKFTVGYLGHLFILI